MTSIPPSKPFQPCKDKQASGSTAIYYNLLIKYPKIYNITFEINDFQFQDFQ